MSDLEDQLVEAFKDREYRESYAEGFLSSWISHQLTAIRRQRAITQKQLAGRIGTKQSGISRMERDDYGRWSLAALQKAAFALGCRLRVSMESFGTLVNEAAHFTDADLWRPAFEDDPVFHPAKRWDPILADPSPLGEMRRKLLPWLWDRGPIEKLADWLQGYDLPPVGDEVSPSQWLLDALPAGDVKLWGMMTEQVRNAIMLRRWDVEPPGQRGKELVRNLLGLAEGLKQPAILGDAVWRVYQRRAHLPLEESKEPAPWHPLSRAILPNQPDSRFRDFWQNVCLREREPSKMPEYVASGLIGLAHMGAAPNIEAIMEGANLAKQWDLDFDSAVRIQVYGFRRLWSEFPDDVTLPTKVIDANPSMPESWSYETCFAWKQSLSGLPQSQNLSVVHNLITVTARAACAA